MDEFRENGRLRGALDASLSGLNGDPYLARRLIACAEKQPKAVRKRSIGLVFAFVALLAAVSVAAAAALNLFEQFGQSERRFAEIAPQTVIDSETASIQTERTGTVTASITNAYYDGESLLIGYTIQGNTSFEPFSPTAKELTHMQPTDDVPDWLHAKTGDSALAKAWENAKQAGMPWGVARYRVSASDHTYTDEGLDLGPWTETEETVVLLSKGEVDSKKIRVEFSLEDMDMSEFQDGATYTQIKDYVLEHSGLKVSNLYISQIKRKCGIGVGKNYNLPKSEDSRQPQCPPEKEKAIREAFKYFGII